MWSRLYTQFKPSGIDWMGDVPDGWGVKRLKLTTRLTDRKVEADEDNPLPYVGLENIQSWTGRLVGLNTATVPTGTANAFKKKHTLFGKLRPYLAKACTPDFDGLCSTELLVLEGIEYDKRALLYALLCDGFIKSVDSSTYGSKMPRANWDFIGNCILPVPPLPEQRAIADFLDRETGKIDQLVAKNRQLIEKLKEERVALISRAVTRGLNPNAKLKPSGVEWLGDVPDHWTVKALKWETPVLRGASPRPIDDPAYFDDEGEYAWVRISDVTTAGMYLTETEQRLSPIGSSLSVKMAPGALFLSIAGSVGKPCITKIKCCIHDGFVYFPRFKGEPRFLYYVFASGESYKGLGKMGTQLNLNTDTVGSIVVGFPNSIEQRAIADHLDRETGKIHRLAEKVEAAIGRLQELRAALITAAVTGKIDVREVAA